MIDEKSTSYQCVVHKNYTTYLLCVEVIEAKIGNFWHMVMTS